MRPVSDRRIGRDTARTPTPTGTVAVVGVVHALGVAAGTLSRVVLCHSYLLLDTTIPHDWVKELGDDGVRLRVPASRVAKPGRAPRGNTPC